MQYLKIMKKVFFHFTIYIEYLKIAMMCNFYAKYLAVSNNLRIFVA